MGSVRRVGVVALGGGGGGVVAFKMVVYEFFHLKQKEKKTDVMHLLHTSIVS
jgi:hypothetical protein